jgi:hypothetical protein
LAFSLTGWEITFNDARGRFIGFFAIFIVYEFGEPAGQSAIFIAGQRSFFYDRFWPCAVSSVYYTMTSDVQSMAAILQNFILPFWLPVTCCSRPAAIDPKRA